MKKPLNFDTPRAPVTSNTAVKCIFPPLFQLRKLLLHAAHVSLGTKHCNPADPKLEQTGKKYLPKGIK